MDKAVQSAPVGKRVHYERRRPEDPGWYKNTSRASLSKPSVRPGRDGPILPKRRSSRPFFNVAVRPGFCAPALRRLHPGEARGLPGTHRVEQLYLLCQKTRSARLVGSQNYLCWSALVVSYTGLSSYEKRTGGRLC